MKFKEIVSAITDLFYPRLCIVCEKSLNSSENHLCTSCIAKIPRTNFHKPNVRNLIEDVFTGEAHAQKAVSWFFFTRNKTYEKLIYALKYRGNSKLARYLGNLYARELESDGFTLDIEIIIPVPLHPERLKSRGYNQSKLIAEGVKNVFGGEIREDILKRHTNTSTQTRKMRFERWENIKDAFSANIISENDLCKKILIIDDVSTTGSTIASCIKCLRERGYKNISVLTLAYSDIR